MCIRDSLEMELHLVGRVNPHFGGPIARRVGEMRASWPGLRHHSDMGDAALADLVRTARATALASIAEGCGLPPVSYTHLDVYKRQPAAPADEIPAD